jgi:hypothetical protein
LKVADGHTVPASVDFSHEGGCLSDVEVWHRLPGAPVRFGLRFDLPEACVGILAGESLIRQGESGANEIGGQTGFFGLRGAHAPSRAVSGALAGDMRLPPRKPENIQPAEWPVRPPQLEGALRNTRGRVCSPSEQPTALSDTEGNPGLR